MYKKWVVLFPWKAASKFYAYHSSSSRPAFKSLTPKLASWSAVLQLPSGRVTSLRGSPWLFQFQLKFLLKRANLGGHLSQIQRQWGGYSWLTLNLEGSWSIRWKARDQRRGLGQNVSPPPDWTGAAGPKWRPEQWQTSELQQACRSLMPSCVGLWKTKFCGYTVLNEIKLFFAWTD